MCVRRREREGEGERESASKLTDQSQLTIFLVKLIYPCPVFLKTILLVLAHLLMLRTRFLLCSGCSRSLPLQSLVACPLPPIQNPPFHHQSRPNSASHFTTAHYLPILFHLHLHLPSFLLFSHLHLFSPSPPTPLSLPS